MVETLLNSLAIKPTVLLLNGATFLVLIFLLNMLFWKPMTAHLDRRRSEIESGYDVVDKTRAEIESLRADYQARINTIEADARARILDTVKDAQAQREAALAAARADADKTMSEGLETLYQERAETIEGMRAKLSDVAQDAVTRTTGTSSTPVHKQLIEEYIRKAAVQS